jgi:predicted O-methyltransferase YrrM
LESLITLVASVGPKTVVEFGINNGRTAKALLEYVPGILTYIGVDVPPEYITAKEVQRREVPPVVGELVQDDPRVRLLVMPGGSQTLTERNLPSVVDAVFIDGDHSKDGVEHDTLLALQCVRPGGIIIWHDYHDLGTVDVREVLNEMYEIGYRLRHVKDTWLVYMTIDR